jgi:hypothetical protein
MKQIYLIFLFLTSIPSLVISQGLFEQNNSSIYNPFIEIPSLRAQHTEPVQLKVYDILGKKDTTLFNQQLQPCTYEVVRDASNYPSGVYYYKLVATDYTETRKMVLIK